MASLTLITLLAKKITNNKKKIQEYICLTGKFQISLTILPTCVFYIPRICCGGYNFVLMCVINWIKHMGGWITCWHPSFSRRKQKQRNWRKKKKMLKSDLVCAQIINTCKLGANWNGQNLKSHKCWCFQLFKS